MYYPPQKTPLVSKLEAETSPTSLDLVSMF